MSNLETLLMDYEDYAALFSKQIYSRELWSEQTGCEVDEYFGYVSCCETKLYDFGTWYEHTTSREYPADPEWLEHKNFKHTLLSFHP